MILFAALLTTLGNAFPGIKAKSPAGGLAGQD